MAPFKLASCIHIQEMPGVLFDDKTLEEVPNVPGVSASGTDAAVQTVD